MAKKSRPALPGWVGDGMDGHFSGFPFCLFCLFRAAPAAYGGSQARGQIGAAATGLCQSHSNTGSELHLWATPQLRAMLDP